MTDTAIAERPEAEATPFVRLHEPVIVEFRDREHWLGLRQGTVGGTDAPALMQGLLQLASNDRETRPDDEDEEEEQDASDELPTSPYQSLYGLWAIKSGLVDRPARTNTRIDWGVRFEEPIARGIAETQGWEMRKCPHYYRHPTVDRMGASLDFEVIERHGGRTVHVPFEIKNVAWTERWKWKLDGYWAPPPHIAIQVQHQLAVTGLPYAYLGVLFGGSEERVFIIERDDEICAKLEEAVIDFWRHVDDGIPPEPDYDRDRWVIKRLFARATPGRTVDWSENEEARHLVMALQSASAAASDLKKMAKEHEEAAEELRARLLHRLGDAEMADLGEVVLNAKTVAGGPVSYERQPYRNIRVAKKKSAGQRR
jgi:predicted phage-related endonuclease